MKAVVDMVKVLARDELAPAKKSQAQRLVELVPDAALFRSGDGETAFATVPVTAHAETWPIRSKGFRRWLVGRFYQMEERPPSAQAVADALGALEARAQFADRVHEVHVRIAARASHVYLDLANEAWETVEITPAGWRLMADPPVKFRRARAMQLLPRPEPGGSLHDLRTFLNVRGDEQCALIVAWAIAAIRGRGPFPVLVLNGEHGSAKSTSARVLRALVDPNTAPLRSEPRDPRDVAIAANNGYVIALDNLSSVETWLSDALCRLATGGGFSTRELYSDSDEAIFSAQRPVIVNGIDEIVTRPDLLDRALLLELPRIDETSRRPESEFWTAFESARPRLLGALLDAVSVALSREASIKLPRLPRMADFAVLATAAAPALGWTDTYFVHVYDDNRTSAHEIALDASPIAAAVRQIADRRREWTGTAAELLSNINDMADEATRRARWWPANPRALAGALRRLAPNLRAVGVETHFERHAGGTRQRLITIEVRNRPDRPDRPGAAVHAPGPRDGGRDGTPARDGDRPQPSPDRPGASTRDIDHRDDRDGRDGHAPPLSVRDEGLL
jgi:hypothetical protein